MNATYWDIWNRLEEIQDRINDFENDDDCHYGDRYYQNLLEQEAELLSELDEDEEEGS